MFPRSYRLWLPKRKTMVFFDDIQATEDEDGRYLLYAFAQDDEKAKGGEDYEQAVLMPFTGLLDVRRRKIFLADIVEIMPHITRAKPQETLQDDATAKLHIAGDILFAQVVYRSGQFLFQFRNRTCPIHSNCRIRTNIFQQPDFFQSKG